MKSLRHVVILIAVLLLLARPATTQAATYFINWQYSGGGSCDTANFYGDNTLPFTYNLPLGGYNIQTDRLNGNVVYGPVQYSAPTGSGSGVGGLGANAGFPVGSLPYTYNYDLQYFDAGGNFLTETVIAITCSPGNIFTISIVNGATPSSKNAITWFNPGDGRVDPRPGDRLAVWCNTTATPPNIVVYGVGDNATNGSHGFWLATFNNADLLKAGKVGITKNAGAGNGTISTMQDGKGDFYVAWNGGIFSATGQGDFAKSFSCTFSK